MDISYLSLLAEQYPTIRAASYAIAALESNLYLPKETEFFLSDLHGEHEAFLHILSSGSGVLRRRVNEILSHELSEGGRQMLIALISHPEEELPLLLAKEPQPEEWIRITLHRMLRLCREIQAKYSRQQVRAMLDSQAAMLLEELLHTRPNDEIQRTYHESILETLIRVGQGQRTIIELAQLLQRLTLTHLHIIGDIYDRGPGAHIILDKLLTFHAIDIQWGNHDIVWMGAAAGSLACITSVIRLSLRYANTETLETGYGISLLPLASFAMDVYGDDLCTRFMPRDADDRVDPAVVDDVEQQLLARMQKAIAIIQFKLEGQIVQRRPQYQMDDRLLLDKIDLTRGEVTIDGTQYALQDTYFPTLDPADPYALSEREQQLVERLQLSFLHSRRLQQHIRFLYAKGGMYRVYNGHLLYHGCIGLEEDGSFTDLEVDGEMVHGKGLMDRVERLAREGYFSTDPARREYGQDAMWYLWSGAHSPLFGKNKMATFERYFVAERTMHVEKQNPYYRFRGNVTTVRRILSEFGLNAQSGRIINGHVPVKVRDGQSPVMAGGQLIVIDGGLAKAYQKQTGIAGYTLISNSKGLLLAEHQPYDADRTHSMHTTTTSIAAWTRRLLIRDTDKGAAIRERIADLEALLDAYRKGVIKEAV